MVVVRETIAEDWQALRDIRLTALRDAPDAFASTYAEQVVYQESDWLARIARRGTFLAYLPGISTSEAAGLVGGYREAHGTVGLISMFVRPQARGRGVGEALIAKVIDWAGDQDATSVRLWVTESNKPARMLYERCGFSPTGERQPLPSKPHLSEIAMIRPL